jgi:hypothetical protein
MRALSMEEHVLSRTRRAAVAAISIALALSGAACARRAPVREAKPSATPAAPSVSPSPAAPAKAADAGYDLRPAEQAAVDEFLRRNPDLRVATDSDHRRSEDEGMDGLYGVYHPYFVRGDDNDDGLLDFVIGFVRRDSDRDTPWFSVVVFAGKADGTFEPGGFLEREISLADGDLSLDRDAIVVTPDVSEDLTRRYRWDPSKHRHVFVRDDATDDDATPPASQI